MFERFTDEARQVVVLAQEEARQLRHSHIGTEHLLLGLLREEQSGGSRPLATLGIHLGPVRDQVRRIVGRGEEATCGQIPFTPRAKKVLELALRQALSLGQNWIGPEHILLGIADENDGVASRILLELEADSERIRSAVIGALAAPRPGLSVQHHVGPAARRGPMNPAWFAGLGDVFDRLAHEIRTELGREPDIGDLLLAIACARPTLAARALDEMAVDLDALWGTLERIRQQTEQEARKLTERLNEVRAQKARALEEKQLEEAARLRDEERELSERSRAQAVIGSGVLEEIRRRLGLPAPPPPGEPGPD